MDFWFGLQGPALRSMEISSSMETPFLYPSKGCIRTFLTREAHEGARHLLSLILLTMTKEDGFS